jgi:hypothetical protein
VKWFGGLTDRAKEEKMKRWHKWFAWHPVVVSTSFSKNEKKVWLEYVDRRGITYSTYADKWLSYQYKERSK